MRLCGISGCDRKHFAKGLCRACYVAKRRRDGKEPYPVDPRDRREYHKRYNRTRRKAAPDGSGSPSAVETG